MDSVADQAFAVLRQVRRQAPVSLLASMASLRPVLIHLDRDKLDVVRVDASPALAQVVRHEPIRTRADQGLIHEPMSEPG
jgi:hypothetical protein